MKLTQTVAKGGCAAKVAAQELRKILSGINFPTPQPNLTINAANFDDAAIYRISETQSLVNTLDFFTPIVDTPRLFGQIATANALSDVYAMGGKPVLALAILALPLISLGTEVAAEILQGSIDKLREAGADLAGGHSIDDDTLKFGLSVTGLVDHNKLITNAGAKPGDTLILTKPLGTGTLMSALKKGVKSESELIEATTSMCTLNNIHDCLQSEDWQYLHAMTDVTGFGLAGHAYQLAKASNVTLTITSAALPRFEHVYETLKTECLTKAHGTNRQYVKDHLIIENTVSDLDQLVFFDPQTSGGLLLSVDEKHAPTLLHKLKAPFPKACVIGQVTEKGDHTLILL